LTTYQDEWVKGRLVRKGTRECANRYAMVKSVCSKIGRPFSVLDIGANMCYFGIRLTEDFEGCSVMAFEFNMFPRRKAVVKANRADRVMLLKRKLSIGDVALMSRVCRFDVILALSVLHHTKGCGEGWVKALIPMCAHLIVELAQEDSARVKDPSAYSVPEQSTVLGYCESHLSPTIERPMIHIKGGLHS